MQRTASQSNKALDIPSVPSHLSIIPDGNRRWGEQKAGAVEAGFEAGMRNIVPVVSEAVGAGVSTITFYGLSSENLMRALTTVTSMWSAIVGMSHEVSHGLNQAGVRIKFIGKMDRLPEEVSVALKSAEDLTAGNSLATVYFALAYSSQQELVDAAKGMMLDGVSPERVDEETLSSYMYAPEMGPVDLLIRTGGELRLSNAPSWRISYAEFFFTDTLWPSFSARHLWYAFADYDKRIRQYGR